MAGYDHVECVVVGAGAIGLAVARQLALEGRSVLILEKEAYIASETSSRNSEVIHAGIYYASNSLKARLCVEGKGLLYEYLNERNIPFRQCGKLIVATDISQSAQLDTIISKAKQNGVSDLKRLTQSEALTMEPELSCHEALLSPSTGIFNTHDFYLSLLADLEDRGGRCILKTEVVSVIHRNGAFEILTIADGEAYRITADLLINSAGLHAVTVAKNIERFPSVLLPDLRLAKGNYFSLANRSPFTRLIYPVPERAGLGIHLTLDMQGRARFGPDVEWVHSIDYAVSAERARNFYHEVRKYCPNLEEGALTPDYSGIRPKISFIGSFDGPQDFVIQTETDHGFPGLVNLFGIESPGLTASLALARYVTAQL